MRNYFLFFLFAAFVSGCGRSGPAKPPQAEALESGNYTEPTGGSAASDVPDGGGAGRDTQTVQVRVEQVETDVDDQEEEEEDAFDVDRKTGRKVARVSSRTVAVKVEVTNGYRAVRVLVSPRRFHIETRDGRIIPPLGEGKREPALPTAYLEVGKSIAGWLRFKVPGGENRVFLRSDFQDPPYRIGFSVPGG